ELRRAKSAAPPPRHAHGVFNPNKAIRFVEGPDEGPACHGDPRLDASAVTQTGAYPEKRNRPPVRPASRPMRSLAGVSPPRRIATSNRPPHEHLDQATHS